MERYGTVEGIAVPLPRDNVDTDTIVRMQRCVEVARDALGPYAFESLRQRADGTPDPACALNLPRYQGAKVLIAGDNFGCGSSREMAVWAMHGMGLRCVIAPRFGDIFFANCFQNGLLPIRLAADVVDGLMKEAAAGVLVLRVDLAAQRIHGAAAGPIAFEVEPLRRTMLLEGTDEIGLTLTRMEEIDAFERTDRALRPWLHANTDADAHQGR